MRPLQVDRRPGAVDDRHPEPGQLVDRPLELGGQLVVLGDARALQHHRHLEVAQALLPAARAARAASPRLDLVGPGHDRERQVARSSALRASGPTTSMSPDATRPGSAWPRGGTMPHVGLWP